MELGPYLRQVAVLWVLFGAERGRQNAAEGLSSPGPLLAVRGLQDTAAEPSTAGGEAGAPQAHVTHLTV